MIRAENVTKVFGHEPESALPLLQQNKSKNEIRDLTGQTVGVNNASFDIEPGEVFAIMGLSGCGKSTLIRCINRLIDPTAGRIILKDPDQGEIDITALDETGLRDARRRHLSMVFQHFALLPHRTVLDNAAYGLEIQGCERNQRQQSAQKVLEMVGLGPWGDSHPSELSGGMQQRVGLARALATEAGVLLMDEPFSALDPLIKVDMQEELRRIQRELNRTILFITHDLDEAMRIGDHIAIMEEGRIVQIGSPEEILVNPLTEYVAKFVEHADPTKVITAGTIALPLNSDAIMKLDGSDAGWFSVPGQPDLRYRRDANNRLTRVEQGEQALRIRPLNEAITESPPPPEQRHQVLLTCSADTVLRDLLRARLHSTRPVVVTGDEDRIHGVISDAQWINGILEKRGYRDEDLKRAGAA